MTNINIKNFPRLDTHEHKINQGIISKKALFNNSFLVTTDANSFFLSQKGHFKNILSKEYSNNKSNGFLLEIIFHGLNYSAKRVSRERPSYILDLHKSEVAICEEPVAKSFASRIHKRRLLFFSYDKQLIFKIGKIIKHLKLPNPYTGKGLFSREDSYVIKKGKKR
jgi:hypothetical protein